MSAYRVLVSGSRSWLWPSVIWDALDDLRAVYGPALVIVHGACSRGADAIADAWCIRRGVAVERHPADWSLGKHAGLLRNALMVESLPAAVLAFIRDDSPGASHCANLAGQAGIPTRRFERRT